jgi:DNA (cytosine-5)-methyltransferase 1
MPTQKTIGTLFSGYGLVESGAKEKGYEPIFAVENNAHAAAVYRENYGDHVVMADIRSVSPHMFPTPDVLWASPSCKPFSLARCNPTPHLDEALGQEVLKFIRALEPETVIIENVVGFRNTSIYQAIADTLGFHEYKIRHLILDASDYGCPQIRRRAILIGSKLDYEIPAKQEKVGWYPAIADLIPSFPLAKLTVAQERAISGRDPSALLVERIGYYAKGPKCVEGDKPCWTMRSTLADDQKGGTRNQFINVIVDGVVRNLTPQGFAALMGLPRDFKLSGDVMEDIRGLGNGVPPQLAIAALP